MIESLPSRLVTICLLVGALAALGIWFGTIPPGVQDGQPLTADRIAASEDVPVGQHVQVTGSVFQTDPVVLTTEYAYWTGTHYRTGSREFVVTGSVTPVTSSQSLQVYGTLRSANTIEAMNSVAVSRINIYYMYVVSALAGVWTLARLALGWTIDWRTLAITRRPEPTTLVALLYRRFREDSTNA
jgi:hypothetical protein